MHTFRRAFRWSEAQTTLYFNRWWWGVIDSIFKGDNRYSQHASFLAIGMNLFFVSPAMGKILRLNELSSLDRVNHSRRRKYSEFKTLFGIFYFAYKITSKLLLNQNGGQFQIDVTREFILFLFKKTKNKLCSDVNAFWNITKFCPNILFNQFVIQIFTSEVSFFFGLIIILQIIWDLLAMNWMPNLRKCYL